MCIRRFLEWQNHVEKYEDQQSKKRGNIFNGLMALQRKNINPDVVMKNKDSFRRVVSGHEEDFPIIEYVLQEYVTEHVTKKGEKLKKKRIASESSDDDLSSDFI